jgi:inner membrane protein
LMDVATHALAGFALARAGLGRLSPAAVPLVMLGAVAPDIDALAGLAGPEAYLEWRRSVTHSWLAAPVLAMAVVVVVRFFRPLHWLSAWIAAWVGVASHILLDAVTLRGVAWLWPVSDRWFAMDWTVTGDPWPGVILSMAVIAPFLSGLVSLEIGARQSPGLGWAIAALAGAGLYFGFRAQLHGEAVTALESRVYDGRPAVRVAALPDAWNPFEWRGLVDDGAALRAIPINLRGDFDPEEGQVFFPPANLEAVEVAKRSPMFRRLGPHVGWPRWQVIPYGDGIEVRLEELRLGFGAMFEVSPAGVLREERFEPPD